MLIASSHLVAQENPCKFRSANHIPQNNLLKHVKETSRDFYYIHLKEDSDTLKICGLVGGEHMTYYRVLGFTNEHFEITTASLNGVASFSISGDGVHVVPSDTGSQTDLLVESSEATWIDIMVSASFESFTSEYLITIGKD